MKNNRQIGLNGKVFVSNCLRRGVPFVFLLIAGGLFTAVTDILKLTGLSGAMMTQFTTTLLIYDFIVTLLLVVVVFYAYFLECGTSVPVLRERPLVVFGLFRLGYYILLAYYICYRALYCLVNHDTVSPSLCIFYSVYFAFIFTCIMANCYIFNILTRNIIRRSYIKSFNRLAVAGIVIQGLLPITYIVARVLMKDVGDEYFTTSICDLLRLCISPLFTFALWFLFIYATEQVKEVFGEVDTALTERRYQITYSTTDQTEDSKKQKALPAGKSASAAFLPTPAGTQPQKSLPASKPQTQAALPPANKAASGIKQPAPTVQQQKRTPTQKPQSNASAAPKSKPKQQPAPAPAQTNAPVSAAPTEFGTIPQPAPVQHVKPAPAQTKPVQSAPVQDYNPFPSKSVPLHKTKQRPKGNGGQRPNNGQYPNNGQRPNGGKNPRNNHR